MVLTLRSCCPACDFVHQAGGETEFFHYRLVHLKENTVIEDGSFVCLHDDYIHEAKCFKYCLLCYALKPLDLFSVHSARQSGRQGECRLCKTIYNGIKNQSRITDQHREASQRRRLYNRLAGKAVKIDSKAIFEKVRRQVFQLWARSSFYADRAERFQSGSHAPSEAPVAS